jgi:Na+-translocating ferredoxin:NAD+ oxidoreductase RnfG subunit
MTFVLLCSAAAYAQSVPEKAASAMHRVFGETSDVKTYSLVIDSSEAEAVYDVTSETVSGRVIIREASDANGKVIGYGIVDDVRGKEQPITYITMMNPDGSIADVEVLVYRESYGGEVAHDQFREQFRGKSGVKELRVGHGIQSIAGATISSKAITNGTRKIVTLFQVWRKERKL